MQIDRGALAGLNHRSPIHALNEAVLIVLNLKAWIEQPLFLPKTIQADKRVLDLLPLGFACWPHLTADGLVRESLKPQIGRRAGGLVT